MSWKPPGPRQQPRSLIVALRKIAKDPNASVKQRLRACELQAIIAGYIAGSNATNAAVPENGNAGPVAQRQSHRNSLDLEEFFKKAEEEDRKKGLSDAGDFSTARQHDVMES